MSKITFYTNSIFPELTRVWYYFIEKNTVGIDKEIVIYDCGSRLNDSYFEGARIIKHPNHEHGKKIDHFIRHNLNTKYLFLMDDDVFLTSGKPVNYGSRFLDGDVRNAICTFLQRHNWELLIKGVPYKPMGSYALLINSDIIREEGLSFRARMTNDQAIRIGTGYYDTADYINEQLLLRDYMIEYVPDDIRKEILTFWGTSSGYVSLVKRNIFGKLRMKQSENSFRDFILKDIYNFQRAYMVAVVTDIYENLFNEKSSLSAFHLDEMIKEIIAEVKDLNMLEKIRHKKAWVDETRKSIMGYLSKVK